MSINVELIGESLIIQHYVAEVLQPHRCRLVSLSDSFTGGLRTTALVTWEMSAVADGTDRALFTNRVLVHATDDFMRVLESRGISFEAAAHERGEAVTAHNQLETPLYAQSIAGRARSRTV